MKYRITARHTHGCSIDLPASKSIGNRALLIGALAGCLHDVVLPTLCDDTQVMLDALSTHSRIIDVHNAGTAMRFLTAYFSCLPGEHILTGTPRMQQRPIGTLVDALRAVGAKITYEGTEGYPPLRIEGSKLCGGSIVMRGDVSSQFISAILMVAPYMSKGLQLTIVGEVLSQPYIAMTIDVMQHCGAQVNCQGNTITVAPIAYNKALSDVESDWSSASYWYEIAYLNSSQYQLNRLQNYFISPQDYPKQGDCKVAYYYNQLGVKTSYNTSGVTITTDKIHRSAGIVELNLQDNPDLAQTIIIGCLLKGQHFDITGLNNLRIKECDRIDALQSEAHKLGYVLSQPQEGRLSWTGERCEVEYPITISTYNDHRMAMAFAPAALVFDEIYIDNAQVVEKSYPTFWDDLQRAGFVITPCPDRKEETPQ